MVLWAECLGDKMFLAMVIFGGGGGLNQGTMGF